MKTALKGATIAGVLMLTAGSAAFAENYTANPGSQYQPYSGAQGYSSNPGAQGNSNSDQRGWSSGVQGSSTQPYGRQSYSQAGNGNGITTYEQAVQELSKYGYGNVHDLRAMQGWSADAMKNGERVHVILGDNGLVATFPGR